MKIWREKLKHDSMVTQGMWMMNPNVEGDRTKPEEEWITLNIAGTVLLPQCSQSIFCSVFISLKVNSPLKNSLGPPSKATWTSIYDENVSPSVDSIINSLSRSAGFCWQRSLLLSCVRIWFLPICMFPCAVNLFLFAGIQHVYFTDQSQFNGKLREPWWSVKCTQRNV